MYLIYLATLSNLLHVDTEKRFRFPGKKSIPNESNEAAISNQFNQVFKSSPRRTGGECKPTFQLTETLKVWNSCGIFCNNNALVYNNNSVSKCPLLYSISFQSSCNSGIIFFKLTCSQMGFCKLFFFFALELQDLGKPLYSKKLKGCNCFLSFQFSERWAIASLYHYANECGAVGSSFTMPA